MQPLHVFTDEEKEKIMKAKDIVTTAKELLAKKLSRRQVSDDNVIFEVSRFDNVIKTVEDTQKVISWISKVDGYVGEVTNKQKPVAKYVTEATQEKEEILEATAADIVLKSYTGAKKDLTKAVEDLRVQRDEYTKKGAHPDIIKLFDAALVYAIATEEAVDSSMNVPLSTIHNYIKKAEEQKNEMTQRLTKEKMPEPVMVVHSEEEVEEVEGDVIAAEIITAPKKPVAVIPEEREVQKKKPVAGAAMVSKFGAMTPKESKSAVITKAPPAEKREPTLTAAKVKPKNPATKRSSVMHMAKQGRKSKQEDD